MKKIAKNILVIIGMFGLCTFMFQSVDWALAKDPDYPTKPINVMISFAAGGVTDISARAFLDAAGKHIEQPFVPINKPGGGGVVAQEAVTLWEKGGQGVCNERKKGAWRREKTLGPAKLI